MIMNDIVTQFFKAKNFKMDARIATAYIFAAHSWIVFTIQIVKYIINASTIKETFYQANVGVVYYFMMVYVL